jgi:hypothetical protein
MYAAGAPGGAYCGGGGAYMASLFAVNRSCCLVQRRFKTVR